jgi:hypothetical protein
MAPAPKRAAIGRRPAALLARSIGSPTAGKLEGAVALEPSRELRLRFSNGAHYGLPALVGMLERSAKRLAARFAGLTLHVGDLSRRDGGELPGHRSHESGRDADVAFLFVGADGESVSPAEFMTVDGRGVALENRSYRFDDARNWALVEAWVTDPAARVEHIFVADRVRARLLGVRPHQGHLPAGPASRGHGDEAAERRSGPRRSLPRPHRVPLGADAHLHLGPAPGRPRGPAGLDPPRIFQLSRPCEAQERARDWAPMNEAPATEILFGMNDLRAPLLGREAEKQALAAAAEAARTGGQARIVTLVGPSGIGKSRLIHDFLQELRAAGGRVPRVYRGSRPQPSELVRRVRAPAPRALRPGRGHGRRGRQSPGARAGRHRARRSEGRRRLLLPGAADRPRLPGQPADQGRGRRSHPGAAAPALDRQGVRRGRRRAGADLPGVRGSAPGRRRLGRALALPDGEPERADLDLVRHAPRDLGAARGLVLVRSRAPPAARALGAALGAGAGAGQGAARPVRGRAARRAGRGRPVHGRRQPRPARADGAHLPRHRRARRA